MNTSNVGTDFHDDTTSSTSRNPHLSSDTADHDEKNLLTQLNEIVSKLRHSKSLKSKAMDTVLEAFGRQDLQERMSGLSEIELKEPILDPSAQKFTAFPINFDGIWELYKKQMACFWTADEIDFSGDADDFKKLSKDEQHFVKMILAFFAASDGIVNFNLGERFIREVQITEAQFAYTFQSMMENTHSEVYSLMLENIVTDENERNYLFNAIETIPSVKMMADWALKWIDSTKSFAHRLIAFAIVEGVFFSGAFAAIYWLKKYKMHLGKSFMNGLVKSNEFIQRDEGMHTDFACHLYRELRYTKLPKEEVYAMFAEATKIAQHFYTDAIRVRLIGMNNDMMNDYIEYIADRTIVSLGLPKLYNKTNPFKFMETIGMTNKQNFHEDRPTDYQKAMTTGSGIVLDDDF